MCLFRKGRAIVFSGLDCAGKSTQINLLMASLVAAGRKPIYLWVRGGYTPFFSFAKRILRFFSKGRGLPAPGTSVKREQVFRNPRIRRLWLQIAIADMILVYGVYLRFSTWLGKDVICDRFVWDTAIDFRLNFPDEKVDRWFSWKFLLWVIPRPSATFLLLIPVSESLRRSGLKFEPFPDSEEVLGQRLDLYRSLAADGQGRVLDCMATIAAISTEIHQNLGIAPPLENCKA